MAQRFTRDGQLFDEAVSALQKSIRRCQVDDAIYWADELFDRYHFYVTRRLMIIAIEDIGMADLMLVERTLGTLSALYGALSDKKTGLDRHDMRYVIAGVVRQLAMAKKSREADEYQHHVIRAMRCGLVPILTDLPTYEEAIGVMFKKTEEHDEVQALTAAIEINNGYVDWLWRDLVVYATINYDDGVVTNLVLQLRNFVRTTLDARGEYEPLCLGLALLLLCRCDQSHRHVDILNKQDAYRMKNPDKRREVPDYALDLHTGRGKRLGRSMIFFNDIGAHIENVGYESKYKMWDKELGSGGMLADNKTFVPCDWTTSTQAQLGKPRKFRQGVLQVNGEDETDLPPEKQPVFELKF